MTHQNTKPFDINSARAGAPIGLARQDGGYKVEVFKYGEEKIFGVLTDPHGNETAEYWNHDGSYGIAAQHGVLSLVMLPLGYCEGKPVFVGDELINIAGKLEVIDVNDNGINFNNLGMKWPKPEPKYPETRMDDLQMADICRATPGNYRDSYAAIANAAIKRAIQDGDVFTKAQVTAVLEELRNICDRQVNPYNIREIVDGTDWDAVLKAAM